MKALFTFSLIVLGFCLKAQSFEKLGLLKEHLNAEDTVEQRVGLQVNQFLDNCIYEHKCGEFSKESIRTFGMVKGFMLSIDRRTRCTQLARGQFLPIRLNDQGLVKDHWNNYRIETK